VTIHDSKEFMTLTVSIIWAVWHQLFEKGYTIIELAYFILSFVIIFLYIRTKQQFDGFVSFVIWNSLLVIKVLTYDKRQQKKQQK